MSKEDKFDKIVNAKPKNERVAFTRKIKKMEELVASLLPIEEKIQEIIVNEKYPIMDEIQELRAIMVKECVHPKDQLALYETDDGEVIECKFCHARLAVK